MHRTISLRIILVLIGLAVCCHPVQAQDASSPTAWRSIDAAGSAAAGTGTATVPVRPVDAAAANPGATAPAVAQRETAPVAPAQSDGITRVDSGEGVLPCDHGQVWREYDISPFTLRATSTKRPEQALVDWILHETGYEAWHGDAVSILSATPKKLRVYHTIEMQKKVAEVVDRFVAGEAATQTFSLRVITLEHPTWRVNTQTLMTPVAVQTPGAQAWIMTKENAAVFLAQMQKRSGFREHGSPHLLVNNGQSTVVQSMRSRSYTRNIVSTGATWPGYQPDLGQLDEGYSIEFTPLLSVDQRQIDAILKCSINQVEKLVPVMVDLPTQASPRQRLKIEVPQLAQFRFQERFRWPTDHVLLVGMGRVAQPVPGDAKSVIPGIPLPGLGGPVRADLLVLIESKGTLAAPTAAGVVPPAVPGTAARQPVRQAQRGTRYHGRY